MSSSYKIPVRKETPAIRNKLYVKRIALYNLKIVKNASFDDIEDHIITMNRKMQYLIWLGCRRIRVEKTKYFILKRSFRNKVHIEFMEWVWENNCPDKTYKTLIENFIKGYNNYFQGYVYDVNKRLCSQEDFQLSDEFIESTPRIFKRFWDSN
jgi:hypothetical protein